MSGDDGFKIIKTNHQLKPYSVTRSTNIKNIGPWGTIRDKLLSVSASSCDLGLK